MNIKTLLIFGGVSVLFNFVLVFFYARLAKAYTYAVDCYKKAVKAVGGTLMSETNWKNDHLWKRAGKIAIKDLKRKR